MPGDQWRQQQHRTNHEQHHEADKQELAPDCRRDRPGGRQEATVEHPAPGRSQSDTGQQSHTGQIPGSFSDHVDQGGIQRRTERPGPGCTSPVVSMIAMDRCTGAGQCMVTQVRDHVQMRWQVHSADNTNPGRLAAGKGSFCPMAPDRGKSRLIGPLADESGGAAIGQGCDGAVALMAITAPQPWQAGRGQRAGPSYAYKCVRPWDKTPFPCHQERSILGRIASQIRYGGCQPPRRPRRPVTGYANVASFSSTGSKGGPGPGDIDCPKEFPVGACRDHLCVPRLATAAWNGRRDCCTPQCEIGPSTSACISRRIHSSKVQVSKDPSFNGSRFPKAQIPKGQAGPSRLHPVPSLLLRTVMATATGVHLRT